MELLAYSRGIVAAVDKAVEGLAVKKYFMWTASDKLILVAGLDSPEP